MIPPILGANFEMVNFRSFNLEHLDMLEHLEMIDSHTHRYPPEVYSNPKNLLKNRVKSHWLELVEPSKGKIAGMGIKGENDADMDAASIAKLFCSVGTGKILRLAFFTMTWHAEWIKEDPERFYAFATIHPSLRNPVDELKKRQEQGFVGIGECHPGVQGFTMKRPILD